MKTVFTLNQLIYPPPWTLGEKTQPPDLIVNPVLSPPALLSYGVMLLKQTKTGQSILSW